MLIVDPDLFDLFYVDLLETLVECSAIPIELNDATLWATLDDLWLLEVLRA